MRINITGYSPQQNHTKLSNRRGIAGMADCLKEILEDCGHEAEYNLENTDLNIVFILNLGSINTYGKYVNSCAELLRKDNTIIAFDDWNIKDAYTSHQKVIDGYTYPSHHNHKGQNIEKNIDVFKKIVNGEFDVLYPAYKTGDHSLLGIKGKELFCLDYSEYIKKEKSDGITRQEIIPVHASLANKSSFLKKLKYDFIDLKKVKEQEVFDNYYSHRVCIMPPHYHDKSGWLRNRYTMANIAGAVIVEDYSMVFGDSYAISGSDVNEENIDNIFSLQNEAYHSVIMTKKEIEKVIERITVKYE